MAIFQRDEHSEFKRVVDLENFQESTSILNACKKKSGNLLNSLRIYIYIYIYHYQTQHYWNIQKITTKKLLRYMSLYYLK